MIVKDNLSAYCSRVEQAASEFLNFRKEQRQKTNDEKSIVGNKKFYSIHIDRVNEIIQKHNISEKSLSKICR